jgi:3-oxoacyl-[acyl-carrier protein] reductase
MDDSTFELMLKVHNTAPFRLIREAAPYLRLKTPEGMKANKSIVTVSSTSGLHGNVGQANYAVAKAGIVGLTKVSSHFSIMVLDCSDGRSQKLIL